MNKFVVFLVACCVLALAGCKSGGGCQKDGNAFPENDIWWEVVK